MPSREAEIESAREQKSGRLAPDDPSRVEKALVEIKERKILERLTAGIAGFRLAFGGLITGSGFALGPEYLREELADGRMVVRGSARASLKKYYLLDLGLRLPRLAGDRIILDLYAARSDSPRMQYYGPGPDSEKGARSNYRLEKTLYEGTFAVKPARPLRFGATGGYLMTNVGPGMDRRFVSTELAFAPATTRGIDRQADFLLGGVFAQYDTRDFPGGARRGGNYVARYLVYSDRKLDQHSFRALEVELQRYLPFFNERRVIALRGKMTLTYTDDGRRVPFYLQPTAGGADDLRGFRPFRFYDDNLLVMNAEYRWETFSGLDMAVFGDAGKVFPRRSQLNFHDLESSVGFGLRFNVRNSVFLRTDVGFSHEGFQVWVKFSNVF